jgi:predicted ATPase
MIDGVIGNKSLPASIRKDIIERTDGIPLFVEEMTKAVLEAGSEGAGAIAAAVPSPALAVPASLHASLMARLDRLGPAKEVAQIGAAIGTETYFFTMNRLRPFLAGGSMKQALCLQRSGHRPSRPRIPRGTRSPQRTYR